MDGVDDSGLGEVDVSLYDEFPYDVGACDEFPYDLFVSCSDEFPAGCAEMYLACCCFRRLHTYQTARVRAMGKQLIRGHATDIFTSKLICMNLEYAST